MAGNMNPQQQARAELARRELARRSSTSQPEEQGVLGAVGAALGSRPELQPYGAPSMPQAPAGPISGALDAATQTLGAPIRAGKTLMEGPDVLGESVSNEMNKAGHPVAGAAIGTGIAMAPELMGAYAGVRGLARSTNPTIRGLMSTPQELSPQYTAQNKVIGLNSRPPEQAGNLKFPNPYNQTLTTKPPVALQTETSLSSNLRGAEALPETTPLKYPKDPATLINTIDERATQFGEKLNQQELYDYKRLLDQNIGDPNKIPKYIDRKPNPLYAQASGLRSRISGILNRVIEPKLSNADLPEGTIPTRAGLDKAYGISNKQQKASKIGGIALGAGIAEEYARRKLGNLFR
jgi:hypothetical protein